MELAYVIVNMIGVSVFCRVGIFLLSCLRTKENMQWRGLIGKAKQDEDEIEIGFSFFKKRVRVALSFFK